MYLFIHRGTRVARRVAHVTQTCIYIYICIHSSLAERASRVASRTSR